MNISSKQATSLLVLLGVLLISNAVLLFLLVSKPSEKMPKDDQGLALRHFLKDELKFSEAQMQSFSTLEKAHKDSIRLVFESLQANRTERLKQVGASHFNDSVIAQNVATMQSNRQMLDKDFFNYLKNVRNICTPEQALQFDANYHQYVMKRKKPK